MLREISEAMPTWAEEGKTKEADVRSSHERDNTCLCREQRDTACSKTAKESPSENEEADVRGSTEEKELRMKAINLDR